MSPDDGALAAAQAASDQEKAQMRTIAGLMLAFYRGLREQGADRMEAVVLSSMTFSNLYDRVREKDGEGDNYWQGGTS